MITHETNIKLLVDKGLVPEDVEVISQTNNLILRSRATKVVARVSFSNTKTERDDPQDASYSHGIAWAMADRGLPVLRPLTPKPLTLDSMVVSLFPLAENVQITDQNYPEIAKVIEEFASFHTPGLRSVDIEKYTQDRLGKVQDQNYRANQRLHDAITFARLTHQKSFSFQDAQVGTVHGDIHSGNMVRHEGKILLIDLDATARGHLFYDFASWRLRQELFDHSVNVEKIVDYARKSSKWDEEAYRALMGWKALSSLTYVLAYGDESTATQHANAIGLAAKNLGALSWQEI